MTTLTSFSTELLAALESEGYSTDHGGTGGGCTALFVNLSDDVQIMLTDGDAMYPTGNGGCVGLYVDFEPVAYTMLAHDDAETTVADYVAAVRAAAVIGSRTTVDVDVLRDLMDDDGPAYDGETESSRIARWFFGCREVAYHAFGEVVHGLKLTPETDIHGVPPFGDAGDPHVILWAMATGGAFGMDVLGPFTDALAVDYAETDQS